MTFDEEDTWGRDYRFAGDPDTHRGEWTLFRGKFAEVLHYRRTGSETVFKIPHHAPENVLDSSEDMERGLVEANWHWPVELPTFCHPGSPIQLKQAMVVEKWEGCVTELFEDFFLAKLRSLITGVEEEGEIQRSSVAPDDLHLLRPGGVFYWSIGRYTDERNRPQLICEIRFRRLPPLSECERVEIMRRAKERFLRIGQK